MKLYKNYFYSSICLLLLILLTSIPNNAKATHLAGGELTWTCVIENGISKYKFKLVIYRNCEFNGGQAATLPNATTIQVDNLNGILSQTLNTGRITANGDINMTLTSKVDISPSCSFGLSGPLDCTIPDAGALEKHVYESGLIDFTGVLPPTNQNTPFIFSWNTCCRNLGIDNIQESGSKSMYLIAKMYPFFPNGSTTAQPVNQCFDNSPEFTEAPAAILYTSGLDFVFNNNASDPDLDNLYYDFADPVVDIDEVVNGTFDPAALWYNYPFFKKDNPLGLLTSQYSFNNFTGEFTFKPIISGDYLTTFKVVSYKCDQKVAEIFRDFQTRILLPDATQNTNRFPTVYPPFKNSNNQPSTEFSVIAGNDLLIPIVVRDSLPGNGFGISSQDLELTVNGIAMGNANADLLDCPFPPCAIMSRNKGNYTYGPGNPAPTAIQNVPGEVFGYGYQLGTSYGSGSTANDTIWVYWPTSCSNLDKQDNCSGLTSSRYNFVVTAKDNFCRVPGKTIRTFSVLILPPDFYLSPQIKCITFDQTSGNVRLQWGESTGDTNTFVRYEIYRENTLLFSTTNRRMFEFTDITPGASPDSTYYVRAVNLCGILDPVYPVKPIKLDAVFYRGNQARLTWNHIRTPKPTTNKGYTVYRSQTINPYNWIAITDADGDTTNNSAIDNFDLCSDTTYYKVEAWDSVGCNSISTIDTIFHPTIIASVKTDTVCFGEPTSFVLTNLSGGVPPYTTVRWLGAEGFSAGNDDSVTYVYPSSGKKAYTFTVIDSKGCRVDITDTAFVRQLPYFSLQFDSSCGGTAINQFGITPDPSVDENILDSVFYSGDNGFLNIKGRFSNPLIRNLQWIFFSNNGRGRFPVEVTLKDIYGCTYTVYDTVVNGDPYVEILADSTACQNPFDTIRFQPYFLTRPFNNVQWIDITDPNSVNVIQSLTDYLPLIQVAGKRFVKLQVIVEDIKGCAGTGYISFNLSPAVTFSPDSLCIGDPVNFELDFANGSDTNNFSFIWELDANTVTTDRRPVHTYTSNGPKIITLTVTDNINNCQTIIRETLTVRDPMDFTIQVNPDCAGLPTTFTPNVISGVDTAWIWTINEYPDVRPNNTITITGVRSPQVVLDAGTGYFKVSLSMNDQNSGCWTTVDTIIKVFNQPDIDFDVDSVNCAGQLTQFISRVIGDSGPYTYSWVGDDNFVDTVANPVHAYPNNGPEYYNVTFTVTNRFGCIVSKTKQVRVCDEKRTLVNVPQIFSPGRERNNTLSVYYSNVDDFEMKIYNRWGIEVFSSEDPNFVWDGKDKSGEYLLEGTYVYIVKANGLGKRNYLNKGTIVVVR